MSTAKSFLPNINEGKWWRMAGQPNPAPWLQPLRQDQQGCCSQVTSAVEEQQKNINIFSYATSALLRALTTCPKWQNRGGNAQNWALHPHLHCQPLPRPYTELCSALAKCPWPLLRLRVVEGYIGQWVHKVAVSHFCTDISWCRTSCAGSLQQKHISC